ncbi:hypothetical protein ACJMK2_001689 [Sinanodonta woodiana]|uniref:Secreted protein n=1 Tax=Sinanodonta woodiana TaxID=1069815 RepID=A0ABD3XWE2_SINWO
MAAGLRRCLLVFVTLLRLNMGRSMRWQNSRSARTIPTGARVVYSRKGIKTRQSRVWKMVAGRRQIFNVVT